MKLIVQEGFKWAHRGTEVEEFEPGAEIETEDQDLIEVSTSEGWTKPADGEEVPPLAKRRGARQ